jgi:hypothetical protein
VLVKNKQGKTPFDLAKSKAVKEAVSIDRATRIIKEWEEQTQEVVCVCVYVFVCVTGQSVAQFAQ